MFGRLFFSFLLRNVAQRKIFKNSTDFEQKFVISWIPAESPDVPEQSF